MIAPTQKREHEVGSGGTAKENGKQQAKSFDHSLVDRDYLFSETYCGGYSGEDPPLPIPNREVKLTIADGTAPPGGRVGSCHFLIRHPVIQR